MYVLDVTENREVEFGARDLLERMKSAGHPENDIERDVLDALKSQPNGRLAYRTFDEGECFSADKGTDARGEPTLTIKTSYFVGIDWLIPSVLALRVTPKLDSQTRRVDVFQTARIVFEFTNNPEDLEGLLWLADRDSPVVETSDECGLLLFLISAYLSLIRSIVKKGLKRSFYTSEENFRYRIKGKILLSETIRHLRLPDPFANVYCEPQHFDIDTQENRFLKCVLKKCLSELQRVADRKSVAHLVDVAKNCLRSFSAVCDAVDASKLKVVKFNPVFKEYSAAFKLGVQILRLENAGVRASQSKQQIPPYWINMARLFELYVYAQITRSLGNGPKIEYQLGKRNGGRLDFFILADSKDHSCGCFIADAKYKPKYNDINVTLEDARQVAGYARLSSLVKRVDEFAGSGHYRFIPCVIVYPAWDAADYFEPDKEKWNNIANYEEMFKVPIKLLEL